MQSEPVLTAGGIVGAILSIVAALIAFGVVDWTPEQVGALEAALLSIVPGVVGWRSVPGTPARNTAGQTARQGRRTAGATVAERQAQHAWAT